MPHNVCGIVIGKSSALVTLDRSGAINLIQDIRYMPTRLKNNAAFDADCLASIGAVTDKVFVQRSDTAPRKHSYEAALLRNFTDLATSRHIPVQILPPIVWKLMLGLSHKAHTREMSRLEAMRYWPDRKEQFSSGDGPLRAEASLIALAGLMLNDHALISFG